MQAPLATAQVQSTERAQLALASPLRGTAKSAELPVSKRQLLARHERPRSFRSLKYCTTWKKLSLGKLLQHPGEIQLSATKAEAFKLRLEAAARISQVGHLRFPGPHSARWLKSA